MERLQVEVEKPSRGKYAPGLVLVLLATVAWIYVSSYVSPFMGWDLTSVKLSFFAALVGASVAFLSGMSRGRLRRIFYDPFFAGYLDLLIVLIPLAAIYFFIIRVFIGELPQSKYIIDQVIAHPFPLISSWIFTFTVFKVLNRLYEGACNLFSCVSRWADPYLRGWRKPAPLQNKVDELLIKLKTQQERMTQATAKAQERSRDLFQRCVQAWSARDEGVARIYAEECSQNRKMAQTLLSSQMALDAVVLRLETVKTLGDIAPLLNPVAGVVRSLEKHLSGVMPEVSEELGRLVEEMNGLTGETNLPAYPDVGIVEFKDGAQKILADAAIVAKRRTQDVLPEIPSRMLTRGAP